MRGTLYGSVAEQLGGVELLHERSHGGALAEVVASLQVRSAVGQRAQGQHVRKVQVGDRPRFVTQPTAVSVAPDLGEPEVGEDVRVHGRMHARDGAVVVAFPRVFWVVQVFGEADLIVDEPPDTRAVVARVARRARAQVVVPGEARRHVLAGPAVEHELVLALVATQQRWWDVAIGDGLNRASLKVAPLVTRGEIHAGRDQIHGVQREEVVRRDLLEQRQHRFGPPEAVTHAVDSTHRLLQ